MFFLFLFPGIGYSMLMVSFLVGVYYNVIIAWVLFYLFASFRADIPWRHCDPSWASKYCLEGPRPSGRYFLVYFWPGPGVLVLSTNGDVPLKFEKWTLRETHFWRLFLKSDPEWDWNSKFFSKVSKSFGVIATLPGTCGDEKVPCLGEHIRISFCPSTRPFGYFWYVGESCIFVISGGGNI